jgi:demethylmenaquinone methyltransferase/2-methoxy-6-polyprenyl-1,4-benzoquinol methylase
VNDEDVDALLAEQIRYYEDRAPEYEDLWHRVGRYAIAPDLATTWFRETSLVEAAVDALGARGSVLELGCGSGLWTRRLAPQGGGRYVAVDSSPTMLALNREGTADPRIDYVQADLFTWSPVVEPGFDLVFMAFFLSHVPPERFEDLWRRVRTWLAPGGRVFLVEDREGPRRPYSSDVVEGGPEDAHRRLLSGERRYTIVKRFWSPGELSDTLDRLDWGADLHDTGEHFLRGTARPR